MRFFSSTSLQQSITKHPEPLDLYLQDHFHTRNKTTTPIYAYAREAGAQVLCGADEGPGGAAWRTGAEVRPSRALQPPERRFYHGGCWPLVPSNKR